VLACCGIVSGKRQHSERYDATRIGAYSSLASLICGDLLAVAQWRLLHTREAS
jgi:hypothetical protein